MTKQNLFDMDRRFPHRLRKHLPRLHLFQNAVWGVLTLVGGVFLGGVGIYFFGTLPVERIKNPRLPEATILYDRSGEHELYRLYDEANREVVPHEAIPDLVRAATIASEDQRFFSHVGIDVPAIIRASVVNWRSKKIEQGASTITQQLARSLFLTREQTWKRKVEEIFLALKIERHFAKEAILDLYLNTVPYGSNAYGIETAAQTFFRKSATALTLEESALLAALPNAPTLYSPYGRAKDELRDRQANILAIMRDQGFITQTEFDQANSIDILSKIAPAKRPIVAPHFVFYAIEELEKEYGAEVLPTAGLKVITTLDIPLQNEAEAAVREGALKNRSYGAENAALVALDARSGEILSLVGSKDFFDTSIDGEVNIITSLRQPGSSFKPLVYAAAFEKGFEPETPIYDIPIDFGPNGSGGRYIPKNYDGSFHGRMTMREALARSLNIPAVTTMALVGLEPTIEFATRLGITSLNEPGRYGLSLVLGGAEVRPLDMASAFAVFSQEGRRIPPTSLQRVEKNGQELKLPGERKRENVLDPEVARKINSILTDNQARSATFGSRSPLAFPRGVTVAAKTGTTQNNRDAWTVGYTSAVSVAVWAGNNDNRPMREGSDGVYVAAPLWRSFMDRALERFPETGFTTYRPVKVLSENSGFGLLENEIHYFDRKNDREITEAEARDLKESRVKRTSSVDLILERADKSRGEEQPGLTSIETIKKLYLPRSAPTQ